MQFRDLQKQYQRLKKEIDQEIQQVLLAGNFISGKQVTELEEQLAEYVGVKHCITCANGTDALTLALMVWNIGRGDAVFVPDFTFFASGETPAYEGASPVFVDVEADTFNLSPASLEQAIMKVKEEGALIPRAIIAVDLFGLPANYPEIQKIADRYGLLILEDGAQGFGGRIGTQKACSFGDISTTSFFPAKPLGCYGDGGAIFTNNDEWAELLKSYRVHGKGADKYDNVRIGINSRLDTIQAAVLKVKLKAFQDYELTDVNKVAAKYTELLSEAHMDLVLPMIADGYYSSWAQYAIQLPERADRNGVQMCMKKAGIPTMVYYPKPMHRQKAFKETNSANVDCLIAEELCKKVLCLPIHPYLEEEECRRIVSALAASLKK
ncbi:MAG: DegT/DnrJ/EryC1/StrS family aminotransferase [Lachnospiraceae bacterium]|uniref:DegT/DnrJ/EryC1/StrS family aminotransferase n=1 Tax=Candidatus Merdisoma sp. JLR.KK011 TaxID=3114299 RepID=UPI002FEFBE98|nr:DegT/DnrJ/EryC1/StrS family aminotransferase [Lachnospiraceae bacterium]